MSKQRTIVVCSCEDTMPVDPDAFRRGCAGVEVVTGRQLCGAELGRFRTLAESGAPLTVGCTQEAPLFREASTGSDSDVSFVNLRESAGWSVDAVDATPKMAALAVAAAEPVPDVPYVHLESAGAILVYGRDEHALEAADLLKDHLDVTVLITRPENLAPPRVAEFPIVRGKVRAAKGHLGAFEIVVDDYATPAPSSRGSFQFGPGRDGAVSHCDIVLDLSGGMPLFPAADLRDGYVRADPGSPAAVLKAVLRARGLVGNFDKPRYVTFDDSLCAHSRSNIVGCRRCLDLCPTGAIAPAGNHVVIDANICAGCGQCATVCPTGAASYALPPVDGLIRKLRTMLLVYREAGGETPILLFHDDKHGGALIDALARHGEGLPANVLPFAVNEANQVGLEVIAAAFAYGAVAIRLLLRGAPRHDVAGLLKTVALAEPILSGLGLTGERVATIETDDPFVLGNALSEIKAQAAVPRPARFSVVGGRREVLRLTLRELHTASAAPVDVISLPPGAPFGAVEVDVGGCTLCLACVSACPTGALTDDPERPLLRFAEDACVQCGLCKATCPEQVIKLIPQLDFRAPISAARVIKEEEPFPCISCGKPFGVKSTIERVVTKLEGKHWMYRNSSKRLDVIKMCDDCRIAIAVQEGFDPHGAPSRPHPRTTDDYLREREIKFET
jgi:ferredoxin